MTKREAESEQEVVSPEKKLRTSSRIKAQEKQAPEKVATKAQSTKEKVETTDQDEIDDTDEKPTKSSKKDSKKLEIGSTIEQGQFVFTNQDNESVDLYDVTQDKGAIVFFYPKANTPGCTKQACGFRDNYDDIVKAGYAVFGCSYDSPKSHTNWKSKQSYQYDFLTDSNGTFIKAVGASKAEKGIKRSHVVISQGGKVADIKIQVSPAESVSEATAFVKSS